MNIALANEHRKRGSGRNFLTLNITCTTRERSYMFLSVPKVISLTRSRYSIMGFFISFSTFVIIPESSGRKQRFCLFLRRRNACFRPEIYRMGCFSHIVSALNLSKRILQQSIIFHNPPESAYGYDVQYSRVHCPILRETNKKSEVCELTPYSKKAHYSVSW